MSGAYRDLELRIEAVEANQGKVLELIDLLEEVKSALRLFVKIGNAFKWLAVLIASVAGAVMVIRKWL